VTLDLRDQLQAALGSSYTILRELAGGGMARVFVATEEAFGRQVVLKVLRPEIGEAVSIERFRRETQLAARLQHPHIVPLFGGGEAGGFLYYTMPLVEGESLRKRLQTPPQLPVVDALRLTREAAEALAYAHARGVVHRDIKPENILLSDGHALVTDFGIARALEPAGGERLTSIGLVVGTPAYMSPEQAAGEPNVDGRSDIYSLGCVLYEMLVGEAPFSGSSVQAIISRRFTEHPPSVRAARASLSREIDSVTSKSLATQPDDRFATAAEFARALDDATVRSLTSAPKQRAALGWRTATFVSLALFGLGVGAWAISRAGATSSAGTTASHDAGSALRAAPPSVAILYLTNRPADTAVAYLADGITEEITSRLAQLGRLRVKSRGAVARIRSANITDPSDAGRALGVDYVVLGSVTNNDPLVRLSVQLVRASDGTEVWTDAYAVAPGGLHAVQDSIVEQVTRNAGGEAAAGLRGAPARRPVNPQAHDHYLRGNFQLAKRNPASVARAIEEFATAARLDPSMTSALAREGYAYSVFADWEWAHPAGLGREALILRGLSAADRALRQDSMSAEGWLARAHLLFLRHPRTLDGVIPAFERAVTFDSTNAEAHYQYGQALMASGHAAQAVSRYRKAIALEPDWASPLMSLGALISRAGEYAEGLKWLDSAIAVDPSSSYSYTARSTTRTVAGKVADALDDAQAAIRVAAGYRVPPFAAMAIALAARGDSANARRWADSTVRAVPDTVRPGPTDAFYASAALVRTGQVGRGLGLLERASSDNAWLWFYMTSPLFDAVRTEPRFVRVSNRAKPPGA